MTLIEIGLASFIRKTYDNVLQKGSWKSGGIVTKGQTDNKMNDFELIIKSLFVLHRMITDLRSGRF